MKLTDGELQNYDDRVLRVRSAKREAYLAQISNLIDQFKKKVAEDASFKIIKFLRAGSLPKGTVLREKVDADIAVFLDFAESARFDAGLLFDEIIRLLVAIYPQKQPEDFTTQEHTLGITFHASGLIVDIVPVIPNQDDSSYAWQPSSNGGEPVLTSISGQLEFIREHKRLDPRYRKLVRLVKAWRNYHELKLSSFTIELLLAHVQDRRGNAVTLEEGLLRFFQWVAQTGLIEPVSFAETSIYPADLVVVIDPVNEKNNVTARMTDGERAEIVGAANDAWEALSTARWNDYKGETLELWKDVFGRSFTIEPAEEEAA